MDGKLNTKDKDLSFYEKLKDLYVTDELSDVEFVLGDPPTIFKSHRFVLSLASDVFRAMFYGKLPEKNLVIPIEDVDPLAFNNILQYIYTKEVTITSFPVGLATAYTARKYMLSEKLFDLCIQNAEGYIDHNYAWEAFEASILFEHPRLRAISKYHLVTNLEKILASEDFLSCSRECLNEFLGDIASYASPATLYKGLVKWSIRQKDSNGLRSSMYPFLHHVRFLAMTVRQFMETMEANYLLTDSEFANICKTIARGRCNPNTPIWLNLNRVVSKVGLDYFTDFSLVKTKEDTTDCVQLFSSFQIFTNAVLLKGVTGWARTTGSRLPSTATLTYHNHTTHFCTKMVCKVESLKSIRHCCSQHDFRCLLPSPRLLEVNDSVTLSLSLTSNENNLTYIRGQLTFKKYSIQDGKSIVQTHPLHDCGILKGVILTHVL